MKKIILLVIIGLSSINSFAFQFVGKGVKYDMKFYGSKKLKPILPWIK